ncbi:MAG TPA: sigma-54 dependent transcriptional regulator [Acidobacteriota bacterium]|jgi:two-component system response regulator AtoC
MSRQSILVVSRNDSLCSHVSRVLSEQYRVDCEQSAEEALDYVTTGRPPLLVFLDVTSLTNSLDILAAIKAADASVPVILLSSASQIESVIGAIEKGAAEYLIEPFDAHTLEVAVENALVKKQSDHDAKNGKAQLDWFEEDFLSVNPKMLRIREITKQVADIDVPVLITGESGVGKEVIARYIHAQSRRRNRPFIKVNCAAIPNDLLESELFGYERGAFTGALQQKPGKFELAGKGTILLDEIGEMSMLLQAKLLHVLQDREYTRLGGKSQVRVDAHILATTNKRLEDAIRRGEFREDLYFRLNVIRIEVPRLADRREDIPLLCNHFLQKYSEKYKSPAQEFPRELLEAFYQYHWAGNVRELKNAVERYLILRDLDMALLDLRDSRFHVREFPQASQALSQANMSLKEIAAQAAEHAEKQVVFRVLGETNGNRKQAALRLDICYKALLNKLKKWQIDERGKEYDLRAAR